MPRGFTMNTANAAVTDVSPGFFTRFLSTLIDPNIVSLLFLAGIAGLGFELFHPGIVIPGAFGAICMVTALFGFSVLPLSWAGLFLVLLGVALLVIDAHVTTHGALTVSGLVAMAIGLITLFHNAPAPYHTNVWLVVMIIGGGIGAALMALGMLGFLSRRVGVSRPPEEPDGGPEDEGGALEEGSG